MTAVEGISLVKCGIEWEPRDSVPLFFASSMPDLPAV